MSAQQLTLSSPEYKVLPEEAKTILSILTEAKILSLSEEDDDLFHLTSNFYAAHDFAVSRTVDGMTFTLLTVKIVKKQTKVIQTSSLEISFPGMTTNPTPALKYVFGEGVQKKNSTAVHNQNYGISKLRVTNLVAQANQMMAQSKLPAGQLVELVSLVYCHHDDALVSQSSVKSIQPRTVLESLKFLLVGLTASKTIRLWAYNMTVEDYKGLGRVVDDSPDRWLDALFSVGDGEEEK